MMYLMMYRAVFMMYWDVFVSHLYFFNTSEYIIKYLPIHHPEHSLLSGRYLMKNTSLILFNASLSSPGTSPYITSQYIIIHPSFVIHLKF